MSTKHSRAGTLQRQRLIQIGMAVACVAFVGMALGAVVIDRSVTPAQKPTPAPIAPAGGPTNEPPEFQPMPSLIASGLSSVYELDALAETPKPGGPKGGSEIPPQEVVLVAAIGQPGSMMAVIREGASQTAMVAGQRAGSVEVLEVKPGWARVRHNGEEMELTVGKPILMVSDMGGGGGGVPTSGQIITQPGSDVYMETTEEGGITRTGGPTTFSRSSGANPRGPGTPGGRRGGGYPSGGNQGSGNQGNGGGGGGGNQANGNGNGQPASGQGRQEDDR